MTVASALRAHAKTIAAKVTDETLDDPFWTERFGARGRENTEKDAAYHVEFFAQAIDAEDPEIARRYARWLRTLLTTRGMCTAHIDENFVRLERVVTEVVGSEAEAVRPYVAAAREALRHEGVAGELEASAEAIAKAVANELGSAEKTASRDADTRLLLAFLADAIALDRPATFVDHVHYVRARDPAVDHVVAAIGRAVAGSNDLRTRARVIVGAV